MFITTSCIRNDMREFRINNFLTLRLEKGKTVIYVDGKPFDQCKYLLLLIPRERVSDLDGIDSIDEASEKLSRVLEPYDDYGDFATTLGIPQEVQFWAHCSNLQAWYENDYDTRLLHSNLSFPLLKELVEVGDSLARKVFKEEIALRLESGYASVIAYLIVEKYADYLDREDFLLSILNEKDASIILEIEEALNIKLSAEYENFDNCDENSFLFFERKVLGLNLFDLNVNLVFKHLTKLKHLRLLSLYSCNLNNLPSYIEDLQDLIFLDLVDNNLKDIPIEIRKLPRLQEISLAGNNITNIDKIVEIVEDLRHLHQLDLNHNKIKILPDNIREIKQLRGLDLRNNLIKQFPGSVKDARWIFL